MTRVLKPQALAPAPVAHANPSQRDWHEDGLAILALLQSTDPKHTAAQAKLREECPWKHSICTQTGKRIEPATNHTVAAYHGKMTSTVSRLQAAGLIPTPPKGRTP